MCIRDRYHEIIEAPNTVGEDYDPLRCDVIYDGSISSNNRKTFKKEGDNDPVMIYQGNNCCYAPILFNDVSYQVESSSLYKIIDNEFVYVNSLGNINIDRSRIKVFQGNVYASVYDYSDGSDYNVIKKLNFEEGSSESLPYVVDEAYASFSKFAFFCKLIPCSPVIVPSSSKVLSISLLDSVLIFSYSPSLLGSYPIIA